METRLLLSHLLEGLADTAVQPVIEDTPLDGSVVAPVVGSPRVRLRLSFSLDEFEQAVRRLDESAASLWPEREPFERAVSLMLIHIEEDLSTVVEGIGRVVLTLGIEGVTRVRQES